MREQIEQTKVKIQLLERTAAMSLITVNLSQSPKRAAQAVLVWDPGETFQVAVRALSDTGRVLADIAVWLVVFTPIWATVGASGALVLRWRQRRAVKGDKL